LEFLYEPRQFVAFRTNLLDTTLAGGPPACIRAAMFRLFPRFRTNDDNFVAFRTNLLEDTARIGGPAHEGPRRYAVDRHSDASSP
jgi:hypothetical protein